MIGQAKKTEQLNLKEAKMNDDAIIHDAQNKERKTIKESDMQAREAMGEMEDQLKSLAQAYRTLESYRDDLVAGLKSMANDVLDKSTRVATQAKHFDIENQIQKAKNIAQNYKFKNEARKEKKKKPVVEETQKKAASKQGEPQEEKSFFDDIE